MVVLISHQRPIPCGPVELYPAPNDLGVPYVIRALQRPFVLMQNLITKNVKFVKHPQDVDLVRCDKHFIECFNEVREEWLATKRSGRADTAPIPHYPFGIVMERRQDETYPPYPE